MAKLVGRKHEVEELNKLYNSDKAQFIAIYGRRRVGKTFLVNQTFHQRITFHHTGLSPLEDSKKATLSEQLQAFHYSLLRSGLDESIPAPKSWLEAFFLLEGLLVGKDNGGRQLIFLDELPWMDTPRSGFLTALESFWNGWASARDNIMLVVCGSSSSWIVNNLINNHGGLYGRLTYEMKLSPFTLSECKEFFKSNGIVLSQHDVTQAYMTFGGIPYYLGYFEPGLSLAQNVDKVLFTSGSPLAHEYDRLFQSLFSHCGEYQKIVTFLATRHYGFTRKEISDSCGISIGGNLSLMLKTLTESDFIISYIPIVQQRKNEYFRLCDPFCLFYLRFVYQKKGLDPHFWQNSQNLPSVASWRGVAFEQVCFNHIPQIKVALGVSGVVTQTSTFLSKGDQNHSGAQIDLLINRADNVINLCEIKFYNRPYTITRQERMSFEYKIDLLNELTKNKKNIHFTLIASEGLTANENSSVVQKVITLHDLFRNGLEP